ncbi:hypothetical protein XI02_38755 [Bradyrhizobium sp. CCBAU 21365]|nr:hypothetical protein XI02_38755 [Bradyrhizobium sp. CCBAU 21365]
MGGLPLCSTAARAFSSEVDTGSREENASKQESRAPFRFHRNGKSSSSAGAGWPCRGTNRTAVRGSRPSRSWC